MINILLTKIEFFRELCWFSKFYKGNYVPLVNAKKSIEYRNIILSTAAFFQLNFDIYQLLTVEYFLY